MKGIKIEIYPNDILNKIISVLFFLVIFLLPYDAVHYLSSMYRPLSLIPLVLLFLLTFPKICADFDKTSVMLIFFYLISGASSFILALVNKDAMSYFADYMVTSTIGLIIFATGNTLFKEMKKNVPDYEVKFASLIGLAYLLPIAVSLVDIVSVYGILPSVISKGIHLVFGGGQSARPTGTTLEASWLSMHMFFASFSYFYLYRKGIRKKQNLALMIASVVILLATVSMQGYIYLAILIVCLWLYRIRKNLTFVNVVLPILAVVLIYAVIKILGNIDTDIYFLKRFKNLSLDYLLSHDASIFIRLINPLIAVIIFLRHPLFGVGGGSYALYYGDIVKEKFSYGLSIYNGVNEIVETINDVSANSKCLYVRLLAEFGLISILYYLFLYRAAAKRNTDIIMKFWLLGVFILMLQFDSFCYFPFLIFLAFYNNIEKKEEVAA